ncbi:MAG: CoA-binding protein [Anaerolineaceae bacterium]|nr:CoA-binding protein [Anaerolineaceae bacterium]
MKETVSDFLAQERIAVVGVSRSEGAAANAIYKKLRETGYQVFPVNPNAQEIEGDPCYANVRSIPEGVDGVIIATQPQVTDQIVRECAAAGISRVWMHRSFGGGSVSPEAVDYCRTHNITVIPGGCPMMFCEPVDMGHKCIRWILNLTGGLPKQV